MNGATWLSGLLLGLDRHVNQSTKLHQTRSSLPPTPPPPALCHTGAMCLFEWTESWDFILRIGKSFVIFPKRVTNFTFSKTTAPHSPIVSLSWAVFQLWLRLRPFNFDCRFHFFQLNILTRFQRFNIDCGFDCWFKSSPKPQRRPRIRKKLLDTVITQWSKKASSCYIYQSDQSRAFLQWAAHASPPTPEQLSREQHCGTTVTTATISWPPGKKQDQVEGTCPLFIRMFKTKSRGRLSLTRFFGLEQCESCVE